MSKHLLLLFLAWLVALMGMQLFAIPRFQACTDEPLFDVRVDYDAEAATRVMRSYGECGRGAYVGIHVWDFPMPLFFGLWLLFLNRRSLTRVRASSAPSAVPRVARPLSFLLPVLLIAFDWAENSGVLVMLQGYPTRPAELLCVFTRIMTVAKFVSYGLAILLSVVLWARQRSISPSS
ncbi:MAG: hypothetical protein RBU37_25785 [Myxococcota bacterium]|jgi:hypothetical protein|nr:hypothetical protein [Myxococcota bacterium]